MVPREELLAWVRRLGKAFVDRGMSEHAGRLRVYFLAVRQGLTSGAHRVEVHWSERMVVEWLKTLRLAPFESAYGVRPRGAGCPDCPASRQARDAIFTDVTLPGGSRMRCDACGAIWLEEDSPGAL